MKVKQGFSLVEIIVALTIIAIAAAFILPNLTTSVEQTKAQAAKNNLLAIAAAQSRFNEDYSSNCAGVSPCYCFSTGTNPTGITTHCGDSISDLNSNLRLSIPSSDTFKYSCVASGSYYSCTATDGPGNINDSLTYTDTGIGFTYACVGTPNSTYCPS